MTELKKIRCEFCGETEILKRDEEGYFVVLKHCLCGADTSNLTVLGQAGYILAASYLEKELDRICSLESVKEHIRTHPREGGKR